MKTLSASRRQENMTCKTNITGILLVCTANVLLVDSTDFVSVTNPTVVQAWFPHIVGFIYMGVAKWGRTKFNAMDEFIKIDHLWSFLMNSQGSDF